MTKKFRDFSRKVEKQEVAADAKRDIEELPAVFATIHSHYTPDEVYELNRLANEHLKKDKVNKD